MPLQLRAGEFSSKMRGIFCKLRGIFCWNGESRRCEQDRRFTEPSTQHHLLRTLRNSGVVIRLLLRAFSKNFLHFPLFNNVLPATVGDRGSTLATMLCYKSDRSLARSQLVSVDFSLTWNPSDRTVALESTQPLTEMSTRCISWG